MLSNADAVSKFKDIIGSTDSWQDLKESQFVNHLAIFNAWALVAAQYGVERAMQEFFLSTAINTSSILAKAEDRAYVPRKPVPASGTISVTNNGTAEVDIQANQAFMSNKSMNFLVKTAATVAPSASVTMTAYQLERSVLTYTVSETKPYYEIVFDAALTSSISAIDVFVDLADGNGSQQWTLARMFQNAYPESHVYDEFFTHLGALGIRFGNGEFGKIAPSGCTVTCALWLTAGDTILLSGQQISPASTIMDNSGAAAQLTITTATAISGGAAPEGVEELKRNLQYWPMYQEQLVWREDYEFFLKKRFPDILWMNVWGEKEAESAAGRKDVDFINRIFVSAYSLSPDIGSRIMAALGEVHLMNRNFRWVDPVIRYFYVSVNGSVSSKYAAGAVEQDIAAILTQNYAASSSGRRTAVILSDIYALIASLGYFSDEIGQFTVNFIADDLSNILLNELVAIDISRSVISISVNG